MGEKPIIFGMYTVKEFLHYCAYGVMGVVFLILFNNRLTIMESKIEVFTEFIVNSDNYHSSVLKTIFKNGKPSNDNFDSKRIADILSQSVDNKKKEEEIN